MTMQDSHFTQNHPGERAPLARSRRPVPVTEQFIASMGCQQHIARLVHEQGVGIIRQ